ncbi:Fumarate and nitrate reduction regulatory protein [Cedecea neteri]|uniref:Fumarate and nitrate reduction regulatory protein n=1 Tax=Cedecea neteri TaxID=158822 RepID=A0A2X3J0X1_9ENTR|nr:Fumarate and nitrate reduction regulatory protein [Cedecea neteri]
MSKSPGSTSRVTWSALTQSAPAITRASLRRSKPRMVCEIPFETLDDLSGKMPSLRQQMMRLMSGEIKGDQDMILLLSKKNAEERLAAFIYNLSRRFAQRGFSPREFRLTMTRGDIGNYLGLTVETISRLLGRFQKKRYAGGERQVHHHREYRSVIRSRGPVTERCLITFSFAGSPFIPFIDPARALHLFHSFLMG